MKAKMTMFEISKLSKLTNSQRLFPWLLSAMLAYLLSVPGTSCLAQTFSRRSDVDTAIAAGVTRAGVTPLLATPGAVPTASTILITAHSNSPAAPNSNYYALGNPPNSQGYYPWGEQYPLAINNNTLSNQYVVRAGIDVIASNVFTKPGNTTASYNFSSQLSAARTAGYSFALCLDGAFETGSNAQTVTDIVICVTKYCQQAASYSSAQRYGGNLCVWIYNDFNNLVASDWASVNTQLAAAGYVVSWVGDVGLSAYYTSVGPSVAVPATLEFAANWSQLYTFGPFSTSSFTGQTLMAIMFGSGLPWGWTMQPGYYNPSNRGSFSDPGGSTAMVNGMNGISNIIRRDYAGSCTFAFESTWDDFGEDTQVQPTSNYGFLRTDLSAWYGSIIKNKAPPFPETRQYLTCPQMLYNNQVGTFDVCITNPSSSSRTTVIKVQNSYSVAISDGVHGNNTSLYSPPHSVVRASVQVTCNSAAISSATPATGAIPFVQVQSTLTDSVTGAIVAKTLSPPCYLSSGTAPTYSAGPAYQPVYWSIGSANQMDSGDKAVNYHLPTGSVTITAGTPTTYKVTMNPATGSLVAGLTCAGLDLIHDTRLEWSTLMMQTQDSAAASTYPLGTAITNKPYTRILSPKDDRADSTDRGFYVIRERTTDGHIIYSDPFKAINN